MEANSLLLNLGLTILLLFIASLSSILLKKINFPYTIGLVIIGLLISIFGSELGSTITSKFELSPHVILYILLPVLIFEASVNMNTRLLFKNVVPVLALAAPGLVISTFVVGIIIKIFTPLTFGPAMLFGALISATDPVAVIGLFKELGAPKRLSILVDGESLFNDGTAIVMFNIVMKMITAGAVFGMATFVDGSIDFLTIFLGGVLIGAVIGYITMRFVSLASNDPMVEIAMSVIAAYTSFIVADRAFGLSGVMSAMGAGMVVSHYGYSRFSPEVRQYQKDFWEFASFAANSFIFLLLGLTAKDLIFGIFQSGKLLIYIAFALAACTLGRIIIVYGILPFIQRLKGQEKISMSYKAVMLWGGLRGALPIALAVSLPSNFQHRDLIIQLTLGVVFFTVLVQGMTIRKLIHFLALDRVPLFEKMLMLQAKLDASSKAAEELELFEKRRFFPPQIIEDVKKEYTETLEKTSSELEALSSDPANRQELRALIWTQSFVVVRETVRDYFDRGIISAPVMKEVDEIVSFQQEKIRKNIIPPPHIIDILPWDMKLKRFIFKNIEKIAPDSRFSEFCRRRIFLIRYELFAFLFESATLAEKRLVYLRKVYPECPDFISECENYYHEIKQITSSHIDTMDQESGGGTLELKHRLLERIASDAGISKLRDATAKGQLPENMERAIEDEIKKAA